MAAHLGFQLSHSISELRQRSLVALGQLLHPLSELLAYAVHLPMNGCVERGEPCGRTLDFAEGLAAHMLDLFPFLSDVKVLRQWAGMADMTPDFAPIMGKTAVSGFYLDSGWGTWGFKATPVCGKTMSHTVANDENHPLIHAFTPDRFPRYALTGEKGAASVGH